MGYKKPPKESQFKKGQTGNPNGRPKKLPELDKLLSDMGEHEYEAVIRTLFLRAKKGDVRAAEVILDRTYGKAKQTIDLNDVTVKQTFVIGGQTIEF